MLSCPNCNTIINENAEEYMEFGETQMVAPCKPHTVWCGNCGKKIDAAFGLHAECKIEPPCELEDLPRSRSCVTTFDMHSREILYRNDCAGYLHGLLACPGILAASRTKLAFVFNTSPNNQEPLVIYTRDILNAEFYEIDQNEMLLKIETGEGRAYKFSLGCQPLFAIQPLKELLY